MSWVALQKAIRKKKHIVAWNQKAVGMENAMPASEAPMRACIVNTHQRLVFKRSMKGLQRGLMTQGKASQPVKRPTSASVKPICIYITTESPVTIMLGSPSAKYRVGIHAHGLRLFLLLI